MEFYLREDLMEHSLRKYAKYYSRWGKPSKRTKWNEKKEKMRKTGFKFKRLLKEYVEDQLIMLILKCKAKSNKTKKQKTENCLSKCLWKYT